MSLQALSQHDAGDPPSLIVARDQVVFALVNLNLGNLQAARWALAQALGAIAELRVDLLREQWMDAVEPSEPTDDATSKRSP